MTHAKTKKTDRVSLVDAFNVVFDEAIQIPSVRWALRNVIDAYDKHDMLEVETLLREVENEINERKKGR